MRARVHTGGRPRNLEREAARLAGERVFDKVDGCPVCGTAAHYVVNGQCVYCTIERAKSRYARLDEAALADHKRRDSVRHKAERVRRP